MRLFVGIELPAALQDRLADLYGDLPDLRWVAPENLHLTLCFIGEVGQHHMADLRDALEEAALEAPAAFEVSVKGLGRFVRNSSGRHNSEGSVLWVGVEGPPELGRLHARIKRALIELGLPPERKKLSPHITIARSKFSLPRGIDEYMQAHLDFTGGSFTVEGFELFSSRLKPGGAEYSIEESFRLARSEGGAV